VAGSEESPPCSRNARPRKALVRRAQSRAAPPCHPGSVKEARAEKMVVRCRCVRRAASFLARRTRKRWSLMIFCARATRGLRMVERGAARPSFLLAERARSEGARSMRAVEIDQATSLKVRMRNVEAQHRLALQSVTTRFVSFSPGSRSIGSQARPPRRSSW
jgi:hypothetical protein